jgi:N-methylhydantoinase A
MGGTTAKAALIHGGRIEMTSEYEVSTSGHGAERQLGYPIRVPVMEIAEVGSGGGSIAWVDHGGALRVGPRSAGAEPGPVCYGRGGTEPTTTDANLVLGRLSADYFMGGEMPLDVAGAHVAIERQIARPLNLDPIEAAAGIIEVANSHMVRALRRVSIEKGRHPRDYALVAFGGAGPLQAAYLAEDLGVSEVIIPQFPGVASAIGMLGSDVRHENQAAFFAYLDEVAPAKVGEQFRALRERAVGRLVACGFPADEVELELAADMRYYGQAYEIRVEWPTQAADTGVLAAMTEAFHEEHKRLYSFSTPGRRVEMIGMRATAIGRVPKVGAEGPGAAAAGLEPKGTRKVHFRGTGTVSCRIFERRDLRSGHAIEGPAVIEQKDSTTLVPPDWRMAIDAFGHLILTRVQPQASE